MFLNVLAGSASIAGFPRASGGVSKGINHTSGMAKFSPRERGCFGRQSRLLARVQVFPARAGVFLRHGLVVGRVLGFPRASGGVSFVSACRHSIGAFSPRERGCFRNLAAALTIWTVSPRERGCFLYKALNGDYVIVFPARAGVFLSAAENSPYRLDKSLARR